MSTKPGLGFYKDDGAVTTLHHRLGFAVFLQLKFLKLAVFLQPGLGFW